LKEETMEAVFWTFLGAAPLDAAPPIPLLAGLALVAIVLLGIVLAAVVLASVFVIRRIKKHRAHREQS